MSESRTELGARLREIRQRIAASSASLTDAIQDFDELKEAAQAVVEVWDSWHYCPGDGGSLQAAVRKLRKVLNADTERPGDGES